ncbi:MAG: hypothetical protein FJ143_05030, partial [Deltaproteobacteria bacterium]|nr:hypothetical protein [Deltaproteobacteria bacterium]
MSRAKNQKGRPNRQSGGDSATQGGAPAVRLLPIAIACTVFVITFGALTITSSLKQAPTFDEPIHLMGGYSYLKWNDYRINPEHPPLVKLWAALPLLWMEIADPRPFTPYWELILKAEPGGPFSPLVREMFFARNDAESLFLPAKLQMILLSMVLGLLVCLWSYQLYGVNAAIAALFLYGLDPNILAHSPIIHSDLPFALLFFLSSYFFW